MSLRIRVTLLFVVIVAIFLSMFSVYVYFNTVKIRTTAFYDRLWERVDIATQILNESRSIDLDSIQPSLRNKYWTTLPEEEIIVYKNSKDFFYINEYMPGEFDYSMILQQINSGLTIETRIGERQYVGCTKRIGTNNSEIIVSAFDKNGKRLLDNLKFTLLTAYLASLIFIVLLGLYFSQRTFSPIARIINSAEKITGSGLHLRVPIPKGKGELAKLANTINDSLSRIETSFKVQKSFVDHASHELRTPITALNGELELALMKDRTSDEYRKVISSSLEDAKRISGLIDQLLLFAQTEATQAVPAKQKLRIDELTLDLLERVSGKFRNRKIEFSLVDSPIEENMLLVEGNEQLLTIAIGNILDNALKYSGNSSPVLFELSNFDRFVTIIIKDHGEGISDTDMEHIFEPFYRSEMVLETEGFGIGLSLSRRIIELHNGTIEIQSQSGIGTTVLIRLPMI